MAAPTVLTNATIWLGGYDLTASTNEVTFNAARQENAVSRFGDTIEATYPGAQTVGAEVKGFWDSTLDGPLHSNLMTPAVWPLTICPDGADDGEVAWGIQSYTFNYSVTEATWGQSLPYRLMGKSRSGDRLCRGLVMGEKATRTSNIAMGGKHQMGAISATQKMIAVVQVFAIVGGSWNVLVMSDADSSPGGDTARATVAGITTAPSYRIVEVAGPITDTWWQAANTHTGGTSVTASATFAIVDV